MNQRLGKIALIIALAVVNVTFGAVTTQVFDGNTLDFTPTDGTATWTMPRTSWANDGTLRTQFASTTYTHNSCYVNVWQRLTVSQIQSDPGAGGAVWHFQSSTPQAMSLSMNFFYKFYNWAGHDINIYYSDNNDWADLQTMTGGTYWADETNPNWKKLYSDQLWGNNSGVDSTVYDVTNDGDFWVRMDFSTTDGVNVSFIAFDKLVVTGTAIPEPVTMTIFGLAGLGLLRRRS